jgi:hypothetical protein
MLRSCCISVLAFALAACSGAFHRQSTVIPAPSNAIGLAPLSGHRVAVLAGTDSAKAISIINADNGQVTATFGVTREAIGLSAESPDGPLLLAIDGHNPNGDAVGSVEQWQLTGMKQQIVPLPLPALGITREQDGEVFVLIGNQQTRAAVQINIPSLHVGTTIALEGGTDDLSLCKLGALAVLVYTDAGSDINARMVDTGQELHSTVVGANPTCIDGDARIFAISKTALSRSVLEVSLPGMQQIAAIGASDDAGALYPADGQGLLVLNEAANASDIQDFDRAQLDAPTTQASPAR